MIINKSGLTIRLNIDTVRVAGRATQGVRLIKLKGGDSIASVAKVDRSEDLEEDSDHIEVNTNENDDIDNNED